MIFDSFGLCSIVHLGPMRFDSFEPMRFDSFDSFDSFEPMRFDSFDLCSSWAWILTPAINIIHVLRFSRARYKSPSGQDCSQQFYAGDKLV